jgi:hypothetical protein
VAGSEVNILRRAQKSGRGLPQSKTLRVRGSHRHSRRLSWTAAALCRFFYASQSAFCATLKLQVEAPIGFLKFGSFGLKMPAAFNDLLPSPSRPFYLPLRVLPARRQPPVARNEFPPCHSARFPYFTSCLNAACADVRLRLRKNSQPIT